MAVCSFLAWQRLRQKCALFIPLTFSFDTQDGMYDVAWSELHENQIASACGDGSIKLWDITLNVR